MIAGLADPSFGTNSIRGGSVAYLNQGFGLDGNANDDGHATTLPSSGSWEFKCTYFYNLAQRGVKVCRCYGHDYQAKQVFTWAGKEKVAADILETLDAAQIYGVRVIPTLGGFSDKKTCAQGYALFDKNSQENKEFKQLLAYVADAIHGHPALIVLEALNEPDYLACISGAKDTGTEAYWLKHFPEGGMQLLKGYAAWQTDLLDGARALMRCPGTPLGNGTAMDSSLYSDRTGNPAMPWGTEECIGTIIPLMAAGCDVWTPHLYQHDDNDNALLVLKRDKITSLVAAAKRAGKQLVLGEAGGLYRGGIWTAKLQAVYDAYPDLIVCWMIRSWDPKVYERPPIPQRVPYSPAPTETPTNPPVEPSIDPSDPAQEPPDEPEVTPEEPAEPQEPAEEEPTGGETGEETPEDDKPANEPPSEDPPEADSPEETEHPNSDKGPSEPSPETGPRIGPGFVLWRVIEWILEAWGKLSKRLKR